MSVRSPFGAWKQSRPLKNLLGIQAACLKGFFHVGDIDVEN